MDALMKRSIALVSRYLTLPDAAERRVPRGVYVCVFEHDTGMERIKIIMQRRTLR
jgi:hypothetical protein